MPPIHQQMIDATHDSPDAWRGRTSPVFMDAFLILWLVGLPALAVVAAACGGVQS